LAGFGTKLGGGCTSSHGVCIVPRLSPRSLIAVPVFLATGVFMAIIRAYYPFLYFTYDTCEGSIDQYEAVANYLYLLMILYFVYDILFNYNSPHERAEPVACFFLGFVFGLGLTALGYVDVHIY
jgi:uncharacterized membrane protein YedE/YeeE